MQCISGVVAVPGVPFFSLLCSTRGRRTHTNPFAILPSTMQVTLLTLGAEWYLQQIKWPIGPAKAGQWQQPFASWCLSGKQWRVLVSRKDCRAAGAALKVTAWLSSSASRAELWMGRVCSPKAGRRQILWHTTRSDGSVSFCLLQDPNLGFPPPAITSITSSQGRTWVSACNLCKLCRGAQDGQSHWDFCSLDLIS